MLDPPGPHRSEGGFGRRLVILVILVGLCLGCVFFGGLGLDLVGVLVVCAWVVGFLVVLVVGGGFWWFGLMGSWWFGFALELKPGPGSLELALPPKLNLRSRPPIQAANLCYLLVLSGEGVEIPVSTIHAFLSGNP